MKYYLYQYLVFRDNSALKQVWNHGRWLFYYQTTPMYFRSRDEAKAYRKQHGLYPCRIGETP